MSAARVTGAIALLLFFSGFFVLCDCPGWYLLAACFSGATVWFGKGVARVLAIVLLVASLAIAGVMASNMINDGKRRREVIRRYQETQKHGTNNVAQPAEAQK